MDMKCCTVFVIYYTLYIFVQNFRVFTNPLSKINCMISLLNYPFDIKVPYVHIPALLYFLLRGNRCIFPKIVSVKGKFH